ncbi:MAG: hypothetical protein MIN69_19565 [Methylorubrum extorquens]|jgi:hypothetical protein|uniref:hypothetical protein n=1 Tax=Methylorubrum extorquens TaxID=408 RepID=UPI002FEE4E02
MFSPWIGTHYGKPDSILSGTRLMILGESHYTSNDDAVGRTDPEDTTRNVEDWAIEKGYKFYTKLSHLVTGIRREDWSFDENRRFWHSVVFYNYIPTYLKKSKRPNAKIWRSGIAPLQLVLEDVRPEVVLVCGLDLWWYAMKAQPGGVALNPPGGDTGAVGTGLGVRIPHPTGSRGVGGYTYERYRPLLEQALAEARV